MKMEWVLSNFQERLSYIYSCLKPSDERKTFPYFRFFNNNTTLYFFILSVVFIAPSQSYILHQLLFEYVNISWRVCCLLEEWRTPEIGLLDRDPWLIRGNTKTLIDLLQLAGIFLYIDTRRGTGTVSCGAFYI